MTGEAKDRVAARLYVGEVEVEFYDRAQGFMATFVQQALASQLDAKRPSAVQPTLRSEVQGDETGESENLVPGLLVEEQEEPSVTDTPDGLDDFEPSPSTTAAEESSVVMGEEGNSGDEKVVDISEDPELIALDKETRRLLKRLESLRQYQVENTAEAEEGGPKTLIDSSSRVVSGKEKHETHKTRRRRVRKAISVTATTIIFAAPFVAPKYIGEYVDDVCGKGADSPGCVAGQSAVGGAKAIVSKGVDMRKGLIGS